MSKIRCRPKKNVDNVKGRHHKIQRKEADDEKIKLEYEGVRVRVRLRLWVWVGVFHYKFEKKLVFSYVQANTYKENAQPEKKIDESICYAIFLYYDRVFDIFYASAFYPVDNLPVDILSIDVLLSTFLLVEILLSTFVYLIIPISLPYMNSRYK
jgi:hypothetical protein